MRAVLVLWDLSRGSKASFEELRTYLRDESMERFRQTDGLRQKIWISNHESGRWGALYLFEAQAQADALVAHIGEGRVVQLTGLEPEVQQFDVEAVVEGKHAGTDLLTAGLAMADS